jgi:tetratricopeptide (TPR) repeat protein
MKALRNLFIFLIVIVVIGFFIPVNSRNGWYNYLYGRVIDMTSNDAGKSADAYKRASEAMPENPTFAGAYARTLNDIASGFHEGDNAERYYNQAYDFANRWIQTHEMVDGVWKLYIEKSRAEWGLGRKTGARSSIEEAVNLMPTDYIALVYQGIIYRDFSPNDKNAIATSIPIFEQAIEVRRETRTSWAHYECAVAYNMLNDEVRALNEIQQALSQWPERTIRQDCERLKNDIQSSGRSNR